MKLRKIHKVKYLLLIILTIIELRAGAMVNDCFFGLGPNCGTVANLTQGEETYYAKALARLGSQIPALRKLLFKYYKDPEFNPTKLSFTDLETLHQQYGQDIVDLLKKLPTDQKKKLKQDLKAMGVQ